LEGKGVEELKKILKSKGIKTSKLNKEGLKQKLLKLAKMEANPTQLKEMVKLVTQPSLKKTKTISPVLSDHYNKTKNYIDMFDQLFAYISYNYRQTSAEFVWLLTLVRFSAINTFTIFCDLGWNMTGFDSDNPKAFMKILAEELMSLKGEKTKKYKRK